MARMHGPAVRRKRSSSICRLYGLASMYPAPERVVLRAVMDISVPAVAAWQCLSDVASALTNLGGEVSPPAIIRAGRVN